MKQEQLIDLPIEWKRGNGLRKSDLDTDGKNKCVLYGELYTKHKEVLIDSDELSKTDKEGTVKSRAGDILIPGTSTAAKEDMLLAREIDEDGVSLGGDINILRPKKGLFAQKYVPYYLETKEAYDQLDKYITGATGIIHISNTGIKNLTIPLPSLEEQRQIVGVLDEAFLAIDKARAKTQQNLRSAKELFESYLQEIFENKSPDWETTTLGEVSSLYQGLAINAKTKHLLVDHSELPLLRIKDLKNNTEEQYVDPGNFPKNALVNIDDIIYTRTGSLGLVFRGRKGVLHNNSFKVVPSAKVLKDFLYIWLQNPIFKNKILELALKAAQPDITHAIFKKQQISFPSTEEQRVIVNKLDTMRAKTQKLEEMYQKKIDDLDELKKSILQKAFAGELTNSKEKALA